MFLQRKRKIDDLEVKLRETESKKTHLSKKITEAQVGREDSKERTELLSKLEEKKTVVKKLHTELDKYKACDPERMKQLKAESVVAKEATNRWTGELQLIVYGPRADPTLHL